MRVFNFYVCIGPISEKVFEREQTGLTEVSIWPQKLDRKSLKLPFLMALISVAPVACRKLGLALGLIFIFNFEVFSF
jgi:hypothetical protein